MCSTHVACSQEEYEFALTRHNNITGRQSNNNDNMVGTTITAAAGATAIANVADAVAGNIRRRISTTYVSTTYHHCVNTA